MPASGWKLLRSPQTLGTKPNASRDLYMVLQRKFRLTVRFDLWSSEIITLSTTFKFLPVVVILRPPLQKKTKQKKSVEEGGLILSVCPQTRPALRFQL